MSKARTNARLQAQPRTPKAIVAPQPMQPSSRLGEPRRQASHWSSSSSTERSPMSSLATSATGSHRAGPARWTTGFRADATDSQPTRIAADLSSVAARQSVASRPIIQLSRPDTSTSSPDETGGKAKDSQTAREASFQPGRLTHSEQRSFHNRCPAGTSYTSGQME